jgi:hypothetical protein
MWHVSGANWFRGNMCLNIILSRKDGRKVSNATERAFHLISPSVSYFEVTLLVPDFRILQLFPFLQNHISSEFTIQTGSNGVLFLPLFSLGSTIRLSGSSVFTPVKERMCTGKHCFSHMFVMGHSISYHSVPSGSNTSLRGLSDETFVYCLRSVFSRLHWTSFIENAPLYWVLNNSYFFTLGGILNSTFIHIYYVGGDDDNYATHHICLRHVHFLFHICSPMLCWHEILHSSTSTVPIELISWFLLWFKLDSPPKGWTAELHFHLLATFGMNGDLAHFSISLDGISLTVSLLGSQPLVSIVACPVNSLTSHFLKTVTRVYLRFPQRYYEEYYLPGYDEVQSDRSSEVYTASIFRIKAWTK